MDREFEAQFDLKAAFTGNNMTTNSTARRGVAYAGCVNQLAKTLPDEKKLKLERLADLIIGERDQLVHVARGHVVAWRCFIELLKILLRYNDAGRHLFFTSPKLFRNNIVSAFASTIITGQVSIDNIDPTLQASYFAAASLALQKFRVGNEGFAQLQNDKLEKTLPAPVHAEFLSSTLRRVVANDEKVSDRQGDKLLVVLLERIKRDAEFLSVHDHEYAQYAHFVKKYLRFLLDTLVARFKMAKKEAKDKDDDGDEFESLVRDARKKEAEADEDEMDDPDFVPAGEDDDEDEEVIGEATPHGIPDAMLAKIANCILVARRVVEEFRDDVQRFFPGIELPARKSRERRMVVWVACECLGMREVQGLRQVGTSFGVKPFVPELQEIWQNIWIGGEAAALHAGAAGFRCVINCASEVPMYYEGFPGMQYLHLPLQSASDFFSYDMQKIQLFVQDHEGEKILVHCREGRSRSVLVLLVLLVSRGVANPLQLVFEKVPYALMEEQHLGRLNLLPREGLAAFQSRFFDATFQRHVQELVFERTRGSAKVRTPGGVCFPVQYLVPLHTFGQDSQYGFVDFAASCALKAASPSVVAHFAAQLSALVPAGNAVLVPYPGHDPGKLSCSKCLVDEMCRLNPRFRNGARILLRTRSSAHRSRGGTRDITEQFESLSVNLDVSEFAHCHFICIDDNMNTGSSFAVFGELMRQAGVQSSRLSGVAVGRFGRSSELQGTGYIIPETDRQTFTCPVRERTVDVKHCMVHGSFVHLQPEGLFPFSSLSAGLTDTEVTVTFASAAEALHFALKAGRDLCVPHFSCDGGFPVEVIDASFIVILFKRALGKSTMRLLGEELQAIMRSLKIDDSVISAVTPLGQLVFTGRSAAKEAKAVMAKLEPLTHQHISFERMYPKVTQRMWIASDTPVEDAAATIRGLAPAGRIAKLFSDGHISSVSERNIRRLDGGLARVIFEDTRSSVPEIKRSASPTWSPTYVFLNNTFLAWATYLAMRTWYEQQARKDAVFGLFFAIFAQLRAHFLCSFDGKCAKEVAERVCEALQKPLRYAKGSHRNQFDNSLVNACTPLLAALHFSISDLWHSLVSDDLIAGMNTTGSSVVQIALSLPASKQSFWGGRVAATRVAAKVHEGADVMRTVQQLPPKQASLRASIVYMELRNMRDNDLMGCSRVIDSSGNRDFEAEFKQAASVIRAISERLQLLQGWLAQFPSWASAAAEKAAVAAEMLRVLNVCKDALQRVSEGALWPGRTHVKPASLRSALTGMLANPRQLVHTLLELAATHICDGTSNVVHTMKEPELADAALSVMQSGSTLSIAFDAGVDDNVATCIPQETAYVFYENTKAFNLTSSGGPRPTPPMATESVASFLEHFKVQNSSSTFSVSGSVVDEFSRAKFYEGERAHHVKEWNARFHTLVHGVVPDNAVEVVESLRRAGTSAFGVMSASCSLLNGSSTMARVRQICDILRCSPMLRNAYRDMINIRAKERQRMAVEKTAQLAVDHLELVTLEYSLHPVVRWMQAAFANPGVDVRTVQPLSMALPEVLNALASEQEAFEVTSEEPEVQRLELLKAAGTVLSKLNRNLRRFEEGDRRDRLQALRQAYFDLCGKAPPTAIVSLGKWNCAQPKGSHWSSKWPRAQFQRCLQQVLVRRAKFKRHCQEAVRSQSASQSEKRGLLMVDIQLKQISEIRSTKQASLLTTLLSGERLDTRAPPKTLFPTLSKDRPWKLRWYQHQKGDSVRHFLIHRDVAASFALAWLSLWERYAYEENLFRTYVLRSPLSVLLRPAAYLYHTDYDKWIKGESVGKIRRF